MTSSDTALGKEAGRSPRAAIRYNALLALTAVAGFCAANATPLGLRFFFIGGPAVGGFPVQLLLLGILLFAVLATVRVLYALGFASRVANWASVWAANWRRGTAFVIAAAFGLSVGIVWILRAFPNSGDEYDYLFQASTFLAGRLWNPLPPVPELFDFFHLSYVGDKWVSLYNPGWPLVLAGGMAAGLPAWLVTPLCGGLLLFAVATLGARRDGPLGGVLATALVASSPFFLFNAASYFPHVPAAAAGLLFCRAAVEFLDNPRPIPAVLAGAALGALGLIRAVDVPIFALPFLIEFVWRARFRHYRLLPVLGAAGLPFLAVLIGFYLQVSGSATPGAGPIVRFGLSPIDEAGQQFTLLDQLVLALRRFVALAEWTSPLLVLGAAAAYFRLTRQRRLSFVDLVFPAFVAAYLLVPFDGGNQYGPRYYFAGFPTLVLTLVSALVPLLTDIARVRRAAAGWFLVIAHGGLSLIALGSVAYWMQTAVAERMDLYDQVAARQLHNAVVVVHSGTGKVAPMHPRDLVRNGIEIGEGNDVIYALDIPDRLAALRALFPMRDFYIYERAAQSRTGSLRLFPASSATAAPAS